MPYVKLDCGILDSSIWIEREQRELFITALLMAKPHDLYEETPQIEPDSLKETGFKVQPGEYGLIEAAGVGIVRRAGLEKKEGMLALKALGEEEADSRSKEHGGRRLVRINGGYLVLNYARYRDKDHTAPKRQERFRVRTVARATVTEFAEAWSEIENFYGRFCAFCGKRPWTEIGYLKTQSQNGGHRPDNIVPTCSGCNEALKGADRKPIKNHPYM